VAVARARPRDEGAARPGRPAGVCAGFVPAGRKACLTNIQCALRG